MIIPPTSLSNSHYPTTQTPTPTNPPHTLKLKKSPNRPIRLAINDRKKKIKIIRGTISYTRSYQVAGRVLRAIARLDLISPRPRRGAHTTASESRPRPLELGQPRQPLLAQLIAYACNEGLPPLPSFPIAPPCTPAAPPYPRPRGAPSKTRASDHDASRMQKI